MNLTPIYQKILKLVRIRGASGGLEITDTAIRFAWLRGSGWQLAMTRLPQGVVVQGQLADPVQFASALKDLKSQMGRIGRGGPIETILVIGSMESCLQVFNLPILEGGALKEAVELNLKIASPIPAERSYAGWQVVGEDEKSLHTEILSAFVDRTIIDSFVAPLKNAGFIVGAVEPSVLALSRIARTRGVGFSLEKPTILAATDDGGMRFSIIRNGMVYFQYFVSWTEVQGSANEITWDAFSAAFSEHFKKVITFYGSHWTGAVDTVFLVAGDLEAGLTELIANQFKIAAYPLRLSDMDDVAEEWYSALGAGVRSLTPLREDKELSLLGVTAREEFVMQQTRNFITFWRVAFPASLAVLLGIGFVAQGIVNNSRERLDFEASMIASSEQARETLALKEKAADFNTAVRLAAGAITNSSIVSETDRVKAFLAKYDATFSTMVVDRSQRVAIQGNIPTEEKLLVLADAFRASTEFTNFDLPFQQIKSTDHGVSFSMTFDMSSSNTP